MIPCLKVDQYGMIHFAANSYYLQFFRSTN